MHMRKSKLDRVLKGIAVAGLAVGGASVVQSGDVVFAKELEHLNEYGEEEQLLSEEFLAASTSASTSEYTSEACTESEDDSLAAESESLTDTVTEEEETADSAAVTAEVASSEQEMPRMVMAGMQVEQEPMTVKTENVDPAEAEQAQVQKESIHTSEVTETKTATSTAVQTASQKTEETVPAEKQSAAETAEIADASEQTDAAATDEEQVPLTVREENIANTRYEDQTLEEAQTPLAANLQSEKSRPLLALIPAVAAVVAGKTLYDRKHRSAVQKENHN